MRNQTELNRSPLLTHVRWGPLWIGLWALAGLLCIPFDDALQPRVSLLGQHPWVNVFAEHWQEFGGTMGILLFIACGVLLFRKDRGAALARFGLCLVAVCLGVQSVKHVVGRARPNLVEDATHFYGPFGMWNTGQPVAIDSMPSGHTATAFVMALALANCWPRLSWLWYLLAAGVGASRTLVGVHFPSDVILGSLLGTIAGLAVHHGTRNSRFAQPRESSGTTHLFQVTPLREIS